MMAENLTNKIKTLIGIEPDETLYDAQIDLQIKTAITRMKMAGIKCNLGTGSDGSVITVGNFFVGNHTVGEIIPGDKIDEQALEYIAVHVQRMLYQEAQTSFYSTLDDLEHELLTTMYYAETKDTGATEDD